MKPTRSKAADKLRVLSCCLALLLLLPGQATPQDHEADFYARLVQTLIDTEAGGRSTGQASVDMDEIQRRLLSETPNARVFGLPFGLKHSPPQGEYRITVGSSPMSDLNPPVWHALKGDPDTQAQYWYRIVNSSGEKQLELLARRQIGEFVFEIRSTFRKDQINRGSINAAFKRLLDNAEINGLLGGPPQKTLKNIPVKEEAPAEAKPRVPAAAAGGIFGRWEGEMRNSRGDEPVDSTLFLEPGPKNSVQGVWHAGWKFKNAKVENGLLRWQQLKVNKGCRDYKVIFELLPDAQSAQLSYTAVDRCREPSSYTGSVNLQRVPTDLSSR